MDYAEQLAKRIIESVLLGAAMRYHTDLNIRNHDFDMEYPDGTRLLSSGQCLVNTEGEEVNA